MDCTQLFLHGNLLNLGHQLETFIAKIHFQPAFDESAEGFAAGGVNCLKLVICHLPHFVKASSVLEGFQDHLQGFYLVNLANLRH